MRLLGTALTAWLLALAALHTQYETASALRLLSPTNRGVGGSRCTHGHTARKCTPEANADVPLNDDYTARFRNIAQLYHGEKSLRRLRDAHVCIIGLGGVGSWVCEAIARSGVGTLTIIDMDDVCISNTNRQLHAMTSTVGRFKGDVLRDRIMDINPHATVNFVKDFVTKSNVDDYLFNNLTGHAFDFVIDAADGVADKASIIDSCVRSDTPVVVCGGAGGLVDPTMLRVSDMAHVTGCSLIMNVRKKLRQKYGYPRGSTLKKGSMVSPTWNVLAVHSLPINKKRHAVADGNGGESDIDIVGKEAGTNSKDGEAPSSYTSSPRDGFRRCDAFGNAVFATGSMGFILASVAVGAIALGERQQYLPKVISAGALAGSRGKSEDAREEKTEAHPDGNRCGDRDGEGHYVEREQRIPGQQNSSGIHTESESGSVMHVSCDSPVEDSGLDSKDSECNCGAFLRMANPANSCSGSGTMRSGRSGNVNINATRAIDGAENGVIQGSMSRSSQPLGQEVGFGSTFGNSVEVSTPANEDLFEHSDVALIDAHCHIQLPGLYERTDAIVTNARSTGISKLVVCATCPGEDWEKLEEISHRHPDVIAPQFGLHPWWVNQHYQQASSLSALEDELVKILERFPRAGVGECGLDKARRREAPLDLQEAVLRAQLNVASRMHRSVTFHCVGAWGRLLSVMNNYSFGCSRCEAGNAATRSGILHSCNSMPSEMVVLFEQLGDIFFSINVKKITSREVNLMRCIPLERLLVETDSPDQLGDMFRDRLACNEPATLSAGVRALATAMSMDFEVLAQQLVTNTENALLI